MGLIPAGIVWVLIISGAIAWVRWCGWADRENVVQRARWQARITEEMDAGDGDLDTKTVISMWRWLREQRYGGQEASQ